MKEKIILFCALLTQVFGYSQAPADVDPSFFLPSGPILYPTAGIKSIAIQSDGKIVIGGQFGLINGTSKVNIARLNINGNLDTTFLSTANNTSSSPGTVNGVGILNSGEIIIGGEFTSVNYGGLRFYIAVFNNDGSINMSIGIPYLDNKVYCVATSNHSFSYGGLCANYCSNSLENNRLNGPVKVIAYQSDGKILIGGDFTTCGITTTYGFTRLDSYGTLDNSFNQAGIGVGGSVSAIALQPDGKIIIAGSFIQYGGVARKGIARLNSNGTLDTTFNPPPNIVFVGNPGFCTIAIQSNGKIIIGGGKTSFNGITRNGITRLNADGSLDTSFDPGAGFSYFTSSSDVKTIVLQSDGKIIVGGSFTSYKGTACNGIVRLIGDSILSLDNQYLKDFNIYPNPANDKFTIDFGNELISNYTIKIINLLGQEVYSNIVDKQQFEISKTWQGEGMYFLKVYNEQNNVVAVKKIILQ